MLNGNISEYRVESAFNIRPHPIYSMFERGTIVFPRELGKKNKDILLQKLVKNN